MISTRPPLIRNYSTTLARSESVWASAITKKMKKNQYGVVGALVLIGLIFGIFAMEAVGLGLAAIILLAHLRDLAHRPIECILIDFSAFLVGIFGLNFSEKISYIKELQSSNIKNNLTIITYFIDNNHQIKLTHHFGALLRTITQSPSSRRANLHHTA